MKAGKISTAELVEAFSISSVTEIHGGPVALKDLREIFGTKGHLLVVQCGLANSDKYNGDVLNPKLCLYGNMIGSARIQAKMRDHPHYPFFDGVGQSSLKALHFHARRNNRNSVVVIAREFSRYHFPPHVSSWRDMEIIRAHGLAEWGYVRELAKVLSERTNLIFLNQALWGVKAMAPVGNRVTQELEELGVKPDAFVGCMASGATMFGIGGKIAEHFPDSKTIVVTKYTTFGPADLRDKAKVRAFARDRLKGYFDRNPSMSTSETDYALFPLHMWLPNIYLLKLWKHTGETGIDLVQKVAPQAVLQVQAQLRAAGHNWTNTTAMALVKAIELANKGRDVVSMVYGTGRAD